MTSVDDGASWRDLADQLAPEQAAELARLEQSWERMASSQSRSRYIRNVSTSRADQQRRLLSMARAWLREKTLTEEENRLAEKADRLNEHCPVAAPPHANSWDPWDKRCQENGVWYRNFVVRKTTVVPGLPMPDCRNYNGWTGDDGGVSVSVGGRQYEDGRCEPWIRPETVTRFIVDGQGKGPDYLGASPSRTLTPEQVRALVSALREAAEEIDRSRVDVAHDATQAGRWRTDPRWPLYTRNFYSGDGDDAHPNISIGVPISRDGRLEGSSIEVRSEGVLTSAQTRDVATVLSEVADDVERRQGSVAAPPVTVQHPAAPRQAAARRTGLFDYLRQGSRWPRALRLLVAAILLGLPWLVFWQFFAQPGHDAAAWALIAVIFVGTAFVFVGEGRRAKAITLCGLAILLIGIVIDLYLSWGTGTPSG